MKKHLGTILFTLGILLVLASIVLAAIETSNKNIIGGADLPTFRFVFLCGKGGLYITLAAVGISSVIASAIIKLKLFKS